MVKHVEQPRETVRQVLAESGAARLRISLRAKASIERIAAERGCPVWMVVDELVGVQ